MSTSKNKNAPALQGTIGTVPISEPSIILINLHSKYYIKKNAYLKFHRNNHAL